VVVPSTVYDAKGLLKAAIRDNDPVIFMESEQMYGDKGEVPDGEYTIPLGVADIKREGTDVTIVSLEKSSKKRTLLLTNWLKKAFHVKLSI
jgi:pyruvate dehydrogenase E1 component beta subunit